MVLIMLAIYFVIVIFISVKFWKARKIRNKKLSLLTCCFIALYAFVIIITDSNVFIREKLNVSGDGVKLTCKWRFKTETMFNWFAALAFRPLGRAAADKILISNKEKMILFQAGKFAYAINRDNGKKIWQKKIGEYNLSVVYPVLFDDKVVFAASELEKEDDIYTNKISFFCLSVKDGKEIWKKVVNVIRVVGGEDNVFITAVNNNIILALQSIRSNNLYMLDGCSGNIIWENKLKGLIVASPSSDGSNLFVPIGESDNKQLSSKIFAINLKKGDVLWEKKTNNDPTGISIFNGYGVYLTENKHKKSENYLECVDLNTGKTVWSNKLFISILDYLPPPFIENGKIYFYANKGNIMAVEVLTGKQIWESLPFGHLGGGSKFKVYGGRKSNLIAYNNIILGSIEFNMGIIDKISGKILCVMDLNSFRSLGLYLDSCFITDMDLFGDMLYFAASDGCIYALNITGVK
ncbi:MAG: PQQ-binding-like beta-propeller repeat protein [Candidatus Omnitrophota bacterium]